MVRTVFWHRLSFRLTAAFLLAAILGVALVAGLAYRSTSSQFGTFLGHVETMERMMGGGMMGGGFMGGISVADAAQAFRNNLGQSLWIAGLAGAALAIFLGSLFARQIVAPLGKVAAAAQRVTQGDLNPKVDIGGSGEIAEVGRSFNLMVASLKRDRELRYHMVADIAHELRTPLSVLRGNVEAMLDGILPANGDNLTSLHQETLLLTRLVEDLRTLSLVEAGQLSFHYQATDLKELAAQVGAGYQTQWAAKNIVFMVEAADDLPLARADPDRTAQVLRNLLSNALHYTPEGGRITLRLASDSQGVVASVVDTGPGIPPEDMERIFDRFYRVDRSRSRSTGGWGLGLTITKQLVEAQGGRIWAESAMGQGSTLSFSLPRLAQ